MANVDSSFLPSRPSGTVRGIVYLDADGVITPERSSWQTIHEVMGTESEASNNYRKFSEGKITFEEWGIVDAELWKGQPIEKIHSAAKEVEPTPGLKETVSAFHDMGLEVGLISTGVRQFLSDIAERADVDFVIANELEVEQGQLTGDVHMHVTDAPKGDYVEEIADIYGLSKDETAAIGDTRHDIEKLKAAGLGIAFNPASSAIREVADVVVEDNGDLREVVPVIRRWFEE